MTIPAGLLALIVIILVLAFVARPFILKTNEQPERLTTRQMKSVLVTRAQLNAGRTKVYKDLALLDEQFAAGDVEEKVYREQRYLLVARGVDILQQLDRLPSTGHERLDTQAEALIATIQDVEPIAATHMACPNCGARVAPQDRFCGQCGHQLQTKPNEQPTLA